MAELIRDEGKRLLVYDDANGVPIRKGCTVIGNPTIGVGRNLVSNGITSDESDLLLSNDIDFVDRKLNETLSFYSQLSDARQRVLCNMAFQLGIEGLLEFRDMLQSVKDGDWNSACLAMGSSEWYNQSPSRAYRLIKMMSSGNA